jgi:hypothetical protein
MTTCCGPLCGGLTFMTKKPRAAQAVASRAGTMRLVRSLRADAAARLDRAQARYHKSGLASGRGVATMFALGPHRVFVYVGITSLSLSRIDRLCAAKLRSKLLRFVKT